MGRERERERKRVTHLTVCSPQGSKKNDLFYYYYYYLILKQTRVG